MGETIRSISGVVALSGNECVHDGRIIWLKLAETIERALTIECALKDIAA